jgi:hypothetical protein
LFVSGLPISKEKISMLVSLKNWWAKPFDSQQNAWNWALTLLFIIVVVAMWGRVIRTIEELA